MTPTDATSAIPDDANEADVLEQRQPIEPDEIDDDWDLPDEIPLDADPADTVDQHRTVPVEDDAWPN